IAPLEAYTLTTIDGIKALENISSTSIKQGKLIKRVKFATRQQKLLGKMLDLIPVIWLLVIFSLSIVLSIALIAKGRKEKL
ncbi:MAG: hypothetical protein U9N50_11700, partial [Pseudomonadota bacterium]|nr:hypothetical protein [Pseudomonadota bacterium]